MPRTLPALAIALLLTLSAAAQDTWQLDPPHSSAQFAVRHLGISTIRGAFTTVSGTVVYDAANPAKSSIQASIDAASVDTRVQKRDDDLRSPNFFDVQKYPTITFQSTKVEPAGAGKLKVTGDLTIHGVTKGQPAHGRLRQHKNQSHGFRRRRRSRHGWRRYHPHARCGNDPSDAKVSGGS